MAYCPQCNRYWDGLLCNPPQTGHRFCPACLILSSPEKLAQNKPKRKKAKIINSFAALKPSDSPEFAAMNAPRQHKFSVAMPPATADTWVTRDRDTGMPRLIRVVDMSDGHILKWIAYYRRQYAAFEGPAEALDVVIQREIVTGPAIYAEAVKRGLIKAPQKSVPSGEERMISLDEGE